MTANAFSFSFHHFVILILLQIKRVRRTGCDVSCGCCRLYEFQSNIEDDVHTIDTNEIHVITRYSDQNNILDASAVNGFLKSIIAGHTEKASGDLMFDRKQLCLS